MKFSGQVLDWNIGGTRRYLMLATRYGQLRDCIKSEIYSAVTNKGEQRRTKGSKVKELEQAKRNGKYVPQAINLSVRPEYREDIVFDGTEATIEADSSKPLAVLNGGHRLEAMEKLRQEGGSTQRTVDNTLIGFYLYLDGNLREDFVALNKDLPVSKDHILSIRISDGLMDHKEAPLFIIAKETAEILHTTPDSCFHNLIQFDSKNKDKLPLSLSALCRKSASDSAFSLYGGAKVAQQHEKDAEWLADCILTAYHTIKDDPDASEALEADNLLAPKPEGTKAGSTFIIALGNMLASRLSLRGIDEPEDSDLEVLLTAVKETLIVPASGNTSANTKRALLGDFCRVFFKDMNVPVTEDNKDDILLEFHDGIPVAVIKLFSPSTFAVSKPPSESKRGRKPKIHKIEVDNEPETSDNEPISVDILPNEEDEEWVEEDKQIKENTQLVYSSAPWDDESEDEEDE